MGRIMYRPGKLSIFLILVLLFQSISSSMISVASAATSTEPTVENLYFTEKDQNEKIQELKVEKEFSIDLILQEGQDTVAEIQLPEGLSLSNESLAQKGLVYEKNTRTLKVDWTKFTVLEKKKRVPLSFTSSFSKKISIHAKTVRNGKIYYSNLLNIIPVSSKLTSTKQEANSEEPIKKEDGSKVLANEVASSPKQDTNATEAIKEDNSSKAAVNDVISSATGSRVKINDKDLNEEANGATNPQVKSFSPLSAAAAFTINNTDSYAAVQHNTNPKFRIYQLDGTSTAAKASINLNLPTWVSNFNAITVSKDNHIYFMANGVLGTTAVNRIFKVNSAGTVVAQFVVNQWSVSATMFGNKYYYNIGTTLYYYDVVTNQHGSIALVNDAGAPLTGLGPDIVADADGYIWFAQKDNLLQVNPDTGKIIRTLPVQGLSHQAPMGARGMSFLPDGRILFTSNGYNELNTRYTIDQDGKLTRLADMVGVPITSGGIGDLGSAVTPKFEPYPPVVESEKKFKILKKGTGTKVDQVQTGDTLVYTVRARNSKAAPSILKGLSFTDTIPAGLEYVPGTLMIDNQSMSDATDTDQGEVIDGKVTGKIGDVLDTNYHTIEFQVKVRPGNDGKTILNTADVTSLNADQQRPTAEFVVEHGGADMTFKKDVSHKKAYVGDTLTYTLEAKNSTTGGIWNGTITDTLPSGLTLVPGSTMLNGKVLMDGDVWSGTNLTVSNVTVKSGETATVTFQVVVDASALSSKIKNIATAVDPEDPNPITTPSIETDVVPNAGELKSSKEVFNASGESINSQEVKIGDQVTYQITAENIGDTTTIINHVKITDDIPKGLSYVPGTLTVNGEAKSDRYVTGQFVTVNDIGSLKGGEKVIVAFTVTVTEETQGDITNIATVEGTVPGKMSDDPEEPIKPQKPKVENTVQLLGQIEVEKVDAADVNIKLKNAVFQILDEEGKEVGTLITDVNGKAISDPLRPGTYTLREVQAPNGYMLLKNPIEVQVSASVQKIKVENTKNEWDIPNTGGIGTIIFYLIGSILMVVTLVLFFRKKKKTN